MTRRGGGLQRTGKLSAERVCAHVAGRVKTKETQLDKLGSRQGTLQRQQAAAGHKAKQQAEIGALLHAIDLQQLEIENAQHLETIDERSRELLSLKVKVATATKVLTAAKKAIAEKDAEFRQISAEIAARASLIAKVDKEADGVNAERDGALEQNQKLQAQLSEFVVPSVLDYVKNKATLKQARAAVATWQRKVEVAEMDHSRYRQRWQAACQQTSLANSAKIAAAVAEAAWQPPGLDARRA